MEGTHYVCHVSQLRRYVRNESHARSLRVRTIVRFILYRAADDHTGQ